MIDPEILRYDEHGLLPVVVQDVASGAVLMLAFADREAVESTLATGQAHFWSRSRRALWRKGETSGNVLEVVEVTADCDGDALLVRARPAGPTCHRGSRSCFEPNPARLELGWLAAVLESRRGADPGASYTARLLAGGIERAAQKVGEEGVETALAAVPPAWPRGCPPNAARRWSARPPTCSIICSCCCKRAGWGRGRWRASWSGGPARPAVRSRGRVMSPAKPPVAARRARRRRTSASSWPTA